MFASIGDNELVYLIRSDNQEALNYLIERYQKRIYGIIKDFATKNGISGLDYEDYYQECFVVFLKCLDLFDDEYSFYHYLHDSIYRMLSRIYKKQKFYKNIISLDYNYTEDGCLLDVISDDEEIYLDDDIENFIHNNLDPLSKQIIEYRKRGYSGIEISQLLGIKRKYFYKKLQLIKQLVNEYLEKRK